MNITIASWNIQGMAPRWRARKESIVHALKPIRPDVVALQECAWRIRHQSMQLAAGLRMSAARAGTLGLLTQDRVAVRNHPMPARARGGSKRFLLADAGPVRIANLHMPLDERVRARYARTLVQLSRDGRPTIICGDFNEGPGGPAISILRDAGFVDSWDGSGGETWPLPHVRARIDFILLSPGMRAANPRLIDPPVAGSDHRGLCVTVQTP